MFKSKESLRLLIFMALVLTVPAVVSHVLPAKGHFDAKPIARLRAKKPNIVILSDSMVDNGVDPELLGKLLSGRRVELLWYGGTASAVWYFRLKNYIVASDVHPELVCILFRVNLEVAKQTALAAEWHMNIKTKGFGNLWRLV